MREILFRGKREDNGEWVEGFYACVLDSHYIITGRFDSLTNGIINSEAYKVDPETVGQFTGLTDKNGRKIFEGDILDFFSDDNLREPDEHSYYAVRWHGTGLVVMDRHSCTDSLDEFFCERCEVIGNIHDNPELLEVSGDE